jgi:hypothetical protein
LLRRTKERRELPNGYSLRSAAEGDVLAEIARTADNERKCCRFHRAPRRNRGISTTRARCRCEDLEQHDRMKGFTFKSSCDNSVAIAPAK